MGVWNYPAGFSPLDFSEPVFELIRNEPRISIFEFASDRVVVLDREAPAKGFFGSVQDAIDEGIGTFSRASAASRFNEDGVLESVGSGVWRLEHDPITKQPLGYLPEQQRTNLALYSEEFNNAGWSKTAGSIEGNASLAPSGAMSADKLIPSIGSSTHQIDFAPSLTDNTSYVWSIFLKEAGLSWAAVTCLTKANSNKGIYINLATGAIGAAFPGGGAPDAYTIRSIGDGWYRVSITINIDSGGTSPRPRVFPASADGGATFSGDGVSGLYLWGAQMEAGVYPTSYIPTVGSTVTRAADVMRLPIAKLPSDGNKWSVISTYRQLANPTATGVILSLANGAAGSFNDCAYLGNSSTLKAALTVRSGGASVAGLVAAGAAYNQRACAAGRLAADNYALSVDGAAATTDVSGAFPTGSIDMFNIGHDWNGNGGNAAAMPIECVILLPRLLSNSELQGRSPL